MASKYSLDMTKGPFLKKILRFSLPLVLTGLLQMIYNTLGNIFSQYNSIVPVESTYGDYAMIYII